MNNTNGLKVSVVIPVYNVQKYLDRCVTSIIQQTYSNLEIILVDDGSTDSSGKMCDEWETKDQRVVVIHKINGGLGFARNSGLERATGDFVAFVDSDDYLRIDAFEKLVGRLIETRAEICYFGCDYDENGIIIKGDQRFPTNTFDREKISKILLPISFGTSIQRKVDAYGVGSVCCALYDSNLFITHKLKFGSEREVLSEDILFTSSLLTKVRSVTFLNENLYFYCYNGSSLTHSYRKDRFEKTKMFYNLQLEMIQKNALSNECIFRAKNSFFINVIVCLKQEMTRNNSCYRDSRKAILDISNDQLFRETYETTDIRKMNIKKQLLFFFLYHRFTRIVFFLVSHNRDKR